MGYVTIWHGSSSDHQQYLSQFSSPQVAHFEWLSFESEADLSGTPRVITGIGEVASSIIQLYTVLEEEIVDGLMDMFMISSSNLSILMLFMLNEYIEDTA